MRPRIRRFPGHFGTNITMITKKADLVTYCNMTLSGLRLSPKGPFVATLGQKLDLPLQLFDIIALAYQRQPVCIRWEMWRSTVTLLDIYHDLYRGFEYYFLSSNFNY